MLSDDDTLTGSAGDVGPRGSAQACLLFERFEVLSFLGEGGFGRVLRCFDRVTGATLAVKLLSRVDVQAMLRFKAEFRLLVDIMHPNLVRLGELFERDGTWGFSLEYLPGTDFLSWVRPEGHPAGFDEQRLRKGLMQLVDGLSTLHAHRLLHRDVKPSNVRVTPEGRVVLLDFGLVVRIDDQVDPEHVTVGSAAYMAPEQANQQPLGPATDLYALGVLIYESVTGQLPITGSPLQILLKKQHEKPSPPSRYAHDVPGFLDQLCLGLLEPDPARRLDERAVREVLAAWGRTTGMATPAVSIAPFVGRSAELASIGQAFQRVRQEGVRLILVEGESGIGKSALIGQTLRALVQHAKTVWTLISRCHVAEQLPYKAFDGAVDALSQHLRELDVIELGSLLPKHAEHLATLFPSLGAVPGVMPWPTRETARPSRLALFDAFIDLLASVCSRTELVIAIDDLQWCDIESLLLLERILDARARLPILIVATVGPIRHLEGEVGRRVLELTNREEVSRLELVGLDEADARRLTSDLLGQTMQEVVVASLSRESHGHPLFLAELARSVLLGRTDHGGTLDLARTIVERVRTLDDASRRVLEALAVEGAPTPLAVLASATGISGAALQAAIHHLRVAKLLSPVQRGEFVCYHDQIREAVITGLEDRAPLHRQLAKAWRAHGTNDYARLAQHWLLAGDARQALPWFERAAEQAEATAAYERAAAHYRTLLAHAALLGGRAHALRLRLGEALARAGRYTEAADVFLESLDAQPVERRARVLVRAAQQKLQAAEPEAGLALAKLACEAADLPWAAPGARLVAHLLWNRASLRLVPLSVGRAQATEVSADTVQKLEVLWRLAQPLGWVDLIRSADIVARHLLLALEHRVPRHIAFGLYSEATLLCVEDPTSPRVATLRAAAAAWTAQCGDADLRAYAEMSEGSIALLNGVRATDRFERAERIYQEDCPGEPWLGTLARAALLGALYNHGRHDEHAVRAEEYLQEARHRSDHFAYAAYALQGWAITRHLMQDRPDRALAEVDEALRPWPANQAALYHGLAMLCRSTVHMYEGGDALRDYWERTGPEVGRSVFGRSGIFSEVTILFRALGALHSAFAAPSSPHPQRLREARHWTHKLRRARTALGRVYFHIMAGQLALFDGDSLRVRDAMASARTLCAIQGYLPVMCSSIMLGALEGSAVFESEEAVSIERLKVLGYTNPRRALRGWFPAVYGMYTLTL